MQTGRLLRPEPPAARSCVPSGPCILGYPMASRSRDGARGRHARRAWDIKAEAQRGLQEERCRDGVPKAREAVALREGALGADQRGGREGLDRLGRLLERSGECPAERGTWNGRFG